MSIAALQGAQTADSARSPLDFDQELARAQGGKRFSRDGVRVLYSKPDGAGSADVVRFGRDVVLSVINCVQPRMARWRYETDEPVIMLRASLSCDVTFRAAGLAPLEFKRPEVTVVCLPAGLPLTADVAGNTRQQGIVAACRASTFAGRYGLVPSDLPPVMLDALAGKGAAGRIASFPMDHRVAALVADTIDTRLEGELRVLQYAGRLAELVAYALDAMHHTPLLRGEVGHALHRRRDVELAHTAMARLERDYRRPPRFADLAREIATNQNKLKAVFKEAFGITMADYCLERRMREAQQLLLEATLTIAQVAERVGYEHQSSFTAAFRGHVGMSPREYRQHRAPFSVPLGKAKVEA
jgi:AraC-like DNA-binding protein